MRERGAPPVPASASAVREHDVDELRASLLPVPTPDEGEEAGVVVDLQQLEAQRDRMQALLTQTLDRMNTAIQSVKKLAARSPASPSASTPSRTEEMKTLVCTFVFLSDGVSRLFHGTVACCAR